jgi:hypothetical protein
MPVSRGHEFVVSDVRELADLKIRHDGSSALPISSKTPSAAG